jgi:hypothetical protein
MSLPKTMRDVAHDVRQRSDDARPDPQILRRRPLEPSRPHHITQHKSNRDDRQRDHDEPGNQRREHFGFRILLIKCCRFRLIQPGIKTKPELLLSDPRQR